MLPLVPREASSGTPCVHSAPTHVVSGEERHPSSHGRFRPVGPGNRWGAGGPESRTPAPGPSLRPLTPSPAPSLGRVVWQPLLMQKVFTHIRNWYLWAAGSLRTWDTAVWQPRDGQALWVCHLSFQLTLGFPRPSRRGHRPRAQGAGRRPRSGTGWRQRPRGEGRACGGAHPGLGTRCLPIPFFLPSPLATPPSPPPRPPARTQPRGRC